VKARHWILSFLVISPLMVPNMACSRDQQSHVVPAPSLTLTTHPTSTLLPALPSRVPATATTTTTPLAPAPTVPLSGPALTDAQFALDVDETGNLIFPATDFVFGVTRVYVRFAYQELGDVTEVESKWYVNQNPVSSSTWVWDGDEEGDYVIWIEDSGGLVRGQWRWELIAEGSVLGGGIFTIGGDPSYINEGWGISLDPPATWELESEGDNVVTFASPDQRRALALTASPATAELPEIAAADLALFQADHPDVEVVVTDEVTMNGKTALLQQVRYAGQNPGDQGPTEKESDGQFLYIVSAIRDDSAYSLWMLGPADDATELERLLTSTLLSVRFLADE
jgi:hypothetical protein